MLIETGEVIQVSSNVTGPIDDFMPAGVGAVMQSIFDFPTSIKVWQPGFGDDNTLKTLEAGIIYYVVSTADVEVPAFSPAADVSEAKSSAQVFRGESLDTAYGILPAIVLESKSTNLITLSIVGRDGLTFTGSKQITATVDVDSAGAVTIADSVDLYSFGDVDAAFDIDTNTITPKFKSTTPGYLGTIKWAVSVTNTRIIFEGIT